MGLWQELSTKALIFHYKNHDSYRSLYRAVYSIRFRISVCSFILSLIISSCLLFTINDIESLILDTYRSLYRAVYKNIKKTDGQKRNSYRSLYRAVYKQQTKAMETW